MIRLLRKNGVVDLSKPCWLWIRHIAPNGYGQAYVGKRKKVPATKFVYEALVGPVPKGYELDHYCSNKSCVNPDHLKIASRRENVLRSNNPTAQNARKTHCKNGHEFTKENTRLKNGERNCYICQRIKNRIRLTKIRRRLGKKIYEGTKTHDPYYEGKYFTWRKK